MKFFAAMDITTMRGYLLLHYTTLLPVRRFRFALFTLGMMTAKGVSGEKI